MKSNELRDLTVQELKERIETETVRYQRMQLQHRVTPLDKPSSLNDQRKLVARLHTVLNEKTVEQGSIND
ncbi:50S ribosomal protein L29 [uncultured Porphyromonas sp.]|uniref:50S ribosomal protein L29 n=1 Tax=uncultured Porphyromonas sp. TaxID=159274 RepID=UPI00262E7DE7|nr:50S ribosomal protein L29 [uncultured Porphyromonas sp.]